MQRGCRRRPARRTSFIVPASTWIFLRCEIPSAARAGRMTLMGQELRVGWKSGPCPLAPVLEKLAGGGLPTIVVLLEGNLQAPHTPPPTEWREVRLKCQAGMI